MQRATSNLVFATLGILVGVALTLVTIVLLVEVESITYLNDTDEPVFLVAKGSDQRAEIQHTPVNFLLEGNFQQIVEIPDELAKRGAFYTFVSQIHSEDLVLELIDLCTDLSPDEERYFCQVTAFKKLASLNPQLAFEQLDGFDNKLRNGLINSLFQEWGKTAPQEAIASAESLRPTEKYLAFQVILQNAESLTNNERKKLADFVPGDISMSTESLAYIQEAQKMDPETAWNGVVNQISNDIDSITLAVNAAVPWIQRDGVGALRKIAATLPNDSIRASVLPPLAEIAAMNEPEEALAFMLDYPERDDHPFTATNRIFQKWTADDPQSALATAVRLDNRSRSTKLQVQALKAWAKHEPEVVWDYLTHQSRDIREKVRSDVLYAMTDDEPHKALALVEALDNSQEQQRLRQMLMRHWGHNSPRSALDLMLAQPINDQNSTMILAAITHLAEQNPREAFELAMNSEIPLKDQMQIHIVRTTAERDVELAIEFLGSISPRQRALVAPHIGRTMLSYDPSRAIDFGQSLDSENQHAYYQYLFNGVNTDNVYAFIEVLDELPTKQLVSMGALSLLRRYERSDRLSSDEKRLLQDRLLPADQEQLDNTQFIHGEPIKERGVF